MKNLIYQYWIGTPKKEVALSTANLKAYADRIGADHMFELNPPPVRAKHPQYYTAFGPVFDERFDEYDNILFCDCDIFAVEGLEENIFEQGIAGIGVVDEKHKEESHLTTTGHINHANDELWAKNGAKLGFNVKRNHKGHVKIFNSGVVYYTRESREYARENWIDFNRYIDAQNNVPRYYALDQNYLNAMLSISKFTVMHPGWNCFVHYDGQPGITGRRPVHDGRGYNPKLIHCQLRGADDKGEKWHHTIVNRPVEEWDV